MMDFSERVIPYVSANFLYQEALSRYEHSRRYIHNNDKILDFGCGTGYGTAIYGNKSRVIGIDSNIEAVNYAKKNYGDKAVFLQGSINFLKRFKRTEFNFISSFELIEHLRNPQFFLGEIRRILKRGGYFVLSTPNKYIHSPDGILHSKYHVKEYTAKELKLLLSKYFSEVTILGQHKSRNARISIKEFMRSQSVRQYYVDNDILNLRRLMPKNLKEKIWKYIGNYFGRAQQNILVTSDFPITKVIKNCEYIIAVCKK